MLETLRSRLCVPELGWRWRTTGVWLLAEEVQPFSFVILEKFNKIFLNFDTNNLIDVWNSTAREDNFILIINL